MVSQQKPVTADPVLEDTQAETAQSNGVLEVALRFVRMEWRRIAAISGLLIVPCFWHREIEAADLGSHVYNAWLVQLIRRGQVYGLWVDHRWNNVLFDYLLSAFGSFLSLHTAERIAVSITVLIFFWGIFAFVSAAARRPPWYLVPAIAMISYGWTFEMGFFNYFLALGLAFFGVAIFWRGQGWQRLIALAIAALVVLAHPLGFLWLVGASAYAVIAERAALRYQIMLLLAAAAILGGIHWYLWRHYLVEAPPRRIAYFFNGADQFLLFGRRYELIGLAFLIFVVGALVLDLVQRRRERRFWARFAVPAQLYLLIFLATLLLPRGIHVPGHIAALALLTQRLTSVSAALLCCLLGAMRPRKWHLTGSAAIAAVFFIFVYQDTGTVNRMEDQVARLVRTLPKNQRVMGTLQEPEEWRVTIQHILDRACIGYCFSYGNYEPGCKMFRVRANPGNPYVLSDYSQAVQTEDGYYTVQTADVPVYQVYQCGTAGANFCIHALEVGEENDDLGVHHEK